MQAPLSESSGLNGNRHTSEVEYAGAVSSATRMPQFVLALLLISVIATSVFSAFDLWRYQADQLRTVETSHLQAARASLGALSQSIRSDQPQETASLLAGILTNTDIHQTTLTRDFHPDMEFGEIQDGVLYESVHDIVSNREDRFYSIAQIRFISDAQPYTAKQRAALIGFLVTNTLKALVFMALALLIYHLYVGRQHRRLHARLQHQAKGETEKTFELDTTLGVEPPHDIEQLAERIDALLLDVHNPRPIALEADASQPAQEGGIDKVDSVSPERAAGFSPGISIIAHELQNPLATIDATATLIGLRNHGQPELRPLIQRIHDNTQRCTRFVTLARNIVGGSRESVSLELVQWMRDIIVQIERPSGIELEFSAEPPSITYALNPTIIELIVRNLVANALTAAATNSPQRQGARTVSVSLRSHASDIEFVVTNTSTARWLEDQSALDPFVTSKPGGLGLGLPICRSLALVVGGKLTLLTEGELTHARLTLPAPSTN